VVIISAFGEVEGSTLVSKEYFGSTFAAQSGFTIKVKRLVWVICLPALLVACGQKGALYLPSEGLLNHDVYKQTTLTKESTDKEQSQKEQ